MLSKLNNDSQSNVRKHNNERTEEAEYSTLKNFEQIKEINHKHLTQEIKKQQERLRSMLNAKLDFTGNDNNQLESYLDYQPSNHQQKLDELLSTLNVLRMKADIQDLNGDTRDLIHKNWKEQCAADVYACYKSYISDAESSFEYHMDNF